MDEQSEKVKDNQSESQIEFDFLSFFFPFLSFLFCFDFLLFSFNSSKAVNGY